MKTGLRLPAVVLVLFSAACMNMMGQSAPTVNWPRFHGRDGSSSTGIANLPLKWSETENIAWKTSLPGPGLSTPVVWGGKIFLTCYTGYDRFEKSDDFSNLQRHVLCIDVADGGILWQKDVKSTGKERQGGPGGSRWTGYAASTAALDEKAVYVLLGNSGVFAFSHEGEEVWHADAGGGIDGWGSAGSAVSCGDKLIVNAAAECGALLALDKKNGRILWKAEDIGRTWSTPVIYDRDGKPEIILNVKGGVAGYDAATGQRTWFCEGARDYVAGSPIINGDILYSCVYNTHRGINTLALNLDQDVSSGTLEPLWTKDGIGAYVSSAVYHDGKLFWPNYGHRVSKRLHGFFCADAETGNVLYQEKPPLVPEEMYASPLLAGDRIYYVSQKQGTYVVAADSEFKLLAHNVIETDKSRFDASPVPLAGGRLLLRSDTHIYCIGSIAEMPANKKIKP